MKNKKKIKYFLVLLVIVIIFAVILIVKNKQSNNTEYVSENIKKTTILQTVSETGTVKAKDDLNLSFLNSSKLAKLNVSVGDIATSGQILAELDYSNLEIKKQEAQANLDVNVSSLNKLLAGATKHDINVMEANVEKAKNSYEAALKDLEDTKNSLAESVKQAQKTVSDLESDSPANVTTYEQAVVIAETNLENTKKTYQNSIEDYKAKSITGTEESLSKANNALDVIDTILSNEDIDNYLSVKNISYLGFTQSNYDKAILLLSKAQSSLSYAKNKDSNGNVSKFVDDVNSLLAITFDDLEYCFTALENSVVSTSFPQTLLDSYKTSISSQQTIISSSISSTQTTAQGLESSIISYDNNVKSAQDSLINAQATYDNALKTAKDALKTAELNEQKQNNSAEARVNAAKDAWDVMKAEFNKLLAPADQNDVKLAQARVEQAQASIDSINKQIEDSVIKSPIEGTITKVNYEIGEQITPGAPVITILGENNYEIEVLISEADIAKIAINDPVEITYDAFGDDDKFYGKVFFIEPAETIVQDVIYYKVKIGMNDASGFEIRSGMTANVIITTNKKENVIAVPSRAVIDKNGDGKFVRVLIGENVVEERKAELGLRGDGGLTEVLSGLKEGDKVVTYIKEN